jgi:hypothetical protein
LNKIAAVTAFIPTFTTEFEKIETSILSKKLGKASQDKIAWIRTCLNNAGQSLNHGGIDKTISEIEKAREGIEELNSAPLNKLQACTTASKVSFISLLFHFFPANLLLGNDG